jgi:hypothetical protein
MAVSLCSLSLAASRTQFVPQRKHFMTKINWLKLLKEIMLSYTEKQMKNAALPIVKTGGKCIY